MNRDRLSRNLQRISYCLPLALFAAALWLVHKQLQNHGLPEILASLATTPASLVTAAIALTIINYLVLAAYDWLALLYTGHRNIPRLKMLAAALLSYSISNNTGHAWAAGGSVRYRFYSRWGVPGWDILKISLFQAVTYWLGALSLGLAGSLLMPLLLAHSTQPPQSIHWLSLICAIALGIYWLAIGYWRKPLTIKGFELTLPSPALTLWQTLIASIDVVLSSLVLWVLLLSTLKLGFATFLVIFVVAQVMGVISQVPGGIGVFESAFLWLMAANVDERQHLHLVSALLLYRAIYYFLPLLLAGCGLLGSELYARRHRVIHSGQAIGQWLTSLLPPLYSLLLLLAGMVLMFSGSIPSAPGAMHLLRETVPLPLVELSHLSASVAGLLLVFLARGLWLRIDAAWYASLWLLSVGILGSLLKGFDWHEATILSVILLLLLPSKHHFYRHSSLLRLSFPGSWLALPLMLLSFSLWLGFFAHRQTEYAHELWWQFSYDGHASRFLRASLLSLGMLLCFGLWRLFSIDPTPPLIKPTAAELDRAQQLAAGADDCQGFPALLGDKYLFWSSSQDAFIMFDTTSHFWVALGDPIGNPRQFAELLWQFREQADYHGAKPVFYQIGEQLLSVYLDLGLSMFKLGQEARIDLQEFSLRGKQRDAQRSAINKFGKLDYRFEILPPETLETALPELRRISDHWLAQKNSGEKGFSLGYFDAEYLRRTPIAVIRDQAGRIKAFANLWQTDNKSELSIDLMRYDQDSPKGIMDYLFAELILWGKAEHFRWFSLGMAPLAGLERRPLAPLWHKIGNSVFDLAGEFYNFEGLYDYKAKFAPHWRPKFLAAQAGAAIPLIMLQISRLIAGGWTAIFSK